VDAREAGTLCYLKAAPKIKENNRKQSLAARRTLDAQALVRSQVS
jgi:hypothetical protein